MEYIPFFRFRTDSMEVAVAASLVLLVFGLLALLYGWKLYRMLLVMSFGLMAAYVAWYFLHPYLSETLGFLVPFFLGLLGALVAIPIQRGLIFLLGAAAGFISVGPVAAELIWRAPDWTFADAVPRGVGGGVCRDGDTGACALQAGHDDRHEHARRDADPERRRASLYGVCGQAGQRLWPVPVAVGRDLCANCRCRRGFPDNGRKKSAAGG